MRCSTAPDRENMTEVLDCEDFDALSEYIDRFPQQIQDDYRLALSFSHFLYIIRVVYNMMVSDGQNENATQAYESMKPHLPSPLIILPGLGSLWMIWRGSLGYSSAKVTK